MPKLQKYHRGQVYRRIQTFVQKFTRLHRDDYDDLENVRIILSGYHEAIKRTGISKAKTEAAMSEIRKLHKQQKSIAERAEKIIGELVVEAEAELESIQKR